MSVWGVIALIGILVNDAVVMLDKYNRKLAEGMNMRDAVIEAGKNRFRPIILTTITTFVGLFPLILERSFQAQRAPAPLRSAELAKHQPCHRRGVHWPSLSLLLCVTCPGASLRRR